MNVKLSLLTLCLVGLLVAVPAQGALPAPLNFTATAGVDDVVFDWDDVVGAVKYSVNVAIDVTYDVGAGPQQIDVELSFGTSDRTDGGDMGDSNLTVAQSDIVDAVLSALAGQMITGVTDLTLDATATVKALSPGKGAGRQNNPPSNTDTFQLIWAAP